MLAALRPASPLAQRVHRIGYLANQSDPRTSSATFKAFARRLGELGWVEGRNLEIRIRTSGGHDELFPHLAAEFVRENVDLIFTTGSASTRAAQAATERIPIIFGSTANPVEQEIVASLARPGGNVTGLAILVQELGPKRLQLLRELLPRVSRVVRIYSAVNIVHLQPPIIREYEAAARRLGIALQNLAVPAIEAIDGIFAEAVRGGAQAALIEADAALIVNRPGIAALGLKHRLPLMCADIRFAEAGALIAYSENFPSMYARAAELADKVLRGAHPRDVPVEQATVFELAVNLKTAEALGISVPEAILVRANRLVR
jgi:putative ABC transport system substrate-binding protein